MTNRNLDERDRKIISLLQENSRIPITELSARLSLSRNAINQRIKKLENDGTIKGYSVVLGEDINPKNVQAVVLVQMKEEKQDCRKLSSEFAGWPEIKSCRSIAGHEDAVLCVTATTLEELSDILLRISKLDRIKRINSHIVLETMFDRQ